MRATDFGCTIASIRSSEEQAAVVKAMEPYIGYSYQNTDNYQGSYAFIGALSIERELLRGFEEGRFSYYWQDGGVFEVYQGNNSRASIVEFLYDDVAGGSLGYVPTRPTYANFFVSEPNAAAVNRSVPEDDLGAVVGLSLDENDSKGIPRGSWMDVPIRKSPAIYTCCVTDFHTCTFE